MPKITILGQKAFEVPKGTNLLRFLQQNHYDEKLPATCGGQGQCSTCAVRLARGGPPPNPNEQDILGDEELAEGWRLSCQIHVEDDLEVIVPGFEPPERVEIAPELLEAVLDYSAEKVPLQEIPSAQTLTRRRLRDLRNRVPALVDGGGDASDFAALRDLFRYCLRTGRVAEIPRLRELPPEQIERIIKSFERRIPAEEEEILTYPYFLYVIVTLLFFLTAGLSLYALVVDAPLEEPATPSFTPNPEKAPWYFLGIQELLADSPNLGGPFTSVAIGGVILPGLFVLFLLSIPYIEPYLEFWRRDRSPPGRRLRERPVTVALFTLVILAFLALTAIGVWFRGPQWDFILPWQ